MCRTFISPVSSWELKNDVTHGITFLTADAYVPTLSRKVRNWFTELNITEVLNLQKMKRKMFQSKLQITNLRSC